MISAIAWVPRGAAKAVPVVAEPTEEELAAMREQLGRGAGDEDEDDESMDASDADTDSEGAGEEEAVARARAAAAAIASSRQPAGASGAAVATDGIEAAMRELDMDNYDNSDDEAGVMTRVLGGRGEVAFDEDGDPYVTLGEDDDDSEQEDFILKDTDFILLAARNEDDVSNLEVWVYEEVDENGQANIYVHHDLVLPAFPLCVAWMDCDPRGTVDRSNMVAIGTLEPGIEIWDLDVVDSVEPVACLGGEDRSAEAEAGPSEGGAGDKKKKKKKAKSKQKRKALLPGSHSDAVLGLSWNREYRNVLASASADKTVKVWDVAQRKCEHTLTHHSGKVQAVAWNPAESPVLLTGAFDKTACLVDVRSPSSAPARWSLSADVEAMCWHPTAPTNFLVSSEDGIVAAFDARMGAGSAPLFRLAAHDAATCAMSLSAAAPGLLATGSTDKKVKLWDISNNTPTLLATQDLQIGAVFSAVFCSEAPHLLGVGGAMGSVTVWDVRAVDAVSSRWSALRLPEQQQQAAAAAPAPAQEAPPAAAEQKPKKQTGKGKKK